MTNEITVGFVPSEVYKVKQVGSSYNLFTPTGKDVGTLGISPGYRKTAVENGTALQAYVMSNGKKIYKSVGMEVFNSLVVPMETGKGDVQNELSKDHTAVKNFIHDESTKLKPDTLVISDLKWKYLIRSAVRAKNIMMTGPAGCGKTMAAKALTKSLDRPDFYFNLGATQDPRATLIGNTHFDKEKGTFFSESAFVKAIKTPNAVILLDELSRAHPDAWNILMTPLDQGQRYLRLDEADGSPIVKVANGVTFIATANIGSEYTSTRVLDRAILDRFTVIEMDVLNETEEFDLLKKLYPHVEIDDLKAIADIANHTRVQSREELGKVTSIISTRASVEMAGLVYDGFSLIEASEISIFPFFSPDGGNDSERTYMKQYVQKFVKTTNKSSMFDDSDIDDIEDTVPQF